MSLVFTTTSEHVVANGVNLLVYGQSGAGKTMLCATAPNPIIITSEDGLLSLSRKNIARVFGENRDDVSYDIPVIAVSTFEDVKEALAFCESENAADFDTVCIDSLSDILEKAIRDYKRWQRDPRKAYGQLGDDGADLVSKFVALDKNTFFIAKQVREQDGFSGKMLYGPSLPGKTLSQGIDYFFDEIFSLEISQKDEEGNSFRYLRTQLDSQYRAKDRSGSLEEFEEPHIGNLIKKIKQQ
jgi:hypothetical protein